MSLLNKIIKKLTNKNYERTKGIYDLPSGASYYTYVYYLERLK